MRHRPLACRAKAEMGHAGGEGSGLGRNIFLCLFLVAPGANQLQVALTVFAAIAKGKDVIELWAAFASRKRAGASGTLSACLPKEAILDARRDSFVVMFCNPFGDGAAHVITFSASYSATSLLNWSAAYVPSMMSRRVLTLHN